MDLSTLIIGLGALMVCIVPIIYFQMAVRNNQKKFLKEFLLLAEQEKVVITQHEVWGNYYGLGLDVQSNKLFYFKRQGSKEDKKVIDLSQVEKCRVVNLNRTVNDNRIIDRVELAFSFRNPKSGEKSLEFYNKEENMSLNDELSLVEKWAEICNERMKSPRKAALT